LEEGHVFNPFHVALGQELARRAHGRARQRGSRFWRRNTGHRCVGHRGCGIERRRSNDIFEKEGYAVETEGSTSPRVGAKRNRVVDVEIERQLEGQPFGNDDGILRNPLLELRQLERPVLQWKGVCRNPGVDAFGEGFEQLLRFW
jgi:hypothetical protein